MKRLAVAVLALGVTLTVPVWGNGLTVVPSAYNPGNAPVTITALWSSDADAPSRHALTLAISQIVSFPPGASATAIVSPIDGLKLTHLGFDHKLGTHCSNGSPRWDVETTDGSSYAFGCAGGIRDVDLPGVGWERVTFSCSDVQVLNGLSGSCPLGSPQTVAVLQIVQDEAASTTLDNLEVNWSVLRSTER
jgi:hypothetical protein